MQKFTPNQKSILALFRKQVGQKFYLRELARKLKKDPGNLSREISVLVENGVLNKSSEGKVTYFSLSHVASKSEELNILDNLDIKKYMSNIEEDIVKLCQTLIRIPSASGENFEETIAEYIFDKAREFKLNPRIVAKDRKRPNLVIDLNSKSASKKPYFLFVGHMDTIGARDIEDWRYHPFSAHLANGRIYGRGAVDMKAGIACELYTMKLIQDLKIDLPVTPRILLVSNEEGGASALSVFHEGMEYLVEEGYVNGIGAIYGYGGSYKLGIGHRGVMRAKISVRGENVHTGSIKWQEREKGINAVTAMAEILLALENMKLPRTKHPSFKRHGNIITPGTMILHGGSAVSTVPDFCESVVEVRFIPGLNIQKVFHKVKEIAERIAKKRKVKIELERFVDIPAVSLSPSERIVRVVASSCKEVYQKKIESRGTGPANESYMMIKNGIPTVVCGPLGDGAHSDNEFVYTNSLVKTVKVYLLTLQKYLTGKHDLSYFDVFDWT